MVPLSSLTCSHLKSDRVESRVITRAVATDQSSDVLAKPRHHTSSAVAATSPVPLPYGADIWDQLNATAPEPTAWAW